MQRITNIKFLVSLKILMEFGFLRLEYFIITENFNPFKSFLKKLGCFLKFFGLKQSGSGHISIRWILTQPMEASPASRPLHEQAESAHRYLTCIWMGYPNMIWDPLRYAAVNGKENEDMLKVDFKN